MKPKLETKSEGGSVMSVDEKQILYMVTVENRFDGQTESGGDWLSIGFGPFSTKREVQTCVRRIKASRKGYVDWDAKKMRLFVSDNNGDRYERT